MHLDEILKLMQLRFELGCSPDDILLISVGELSHRKNHELMIKSIARSKNRNIVYCIAGQGELQEYLGRLIQDLNLSQRVKLLGYRNDIQNLYGAADFAALPSFQEGLPVALMEAMACGLPVIVSRIRGIVDLVDSSGGELFNPFDTDECVKAIDRMYVADRLAMGSQNKMKIENFSIEIVLNKMCRIYKNE